MNKMKPATDQTATRDQPQCTWAYAANRIVVMNIVPVTESPKAAAMAADDPNAITSPRHATISDQFTNGR